MRTERMLCHRPFGTRCIHISAEAFSFFFPITEDDDEDAQAIGAFRLPLDSKSTQAQAHSQVGVFVLDSRLPDRRCHSVTVAMTQLRL